MNIRKPKLPCLPPAGDIAGSSHGQRPEFREVYQAHDDHADREKTFGGGDHRTPGSYGHQGTQDRCHATQGLYGDTVLNHAHVGGTFEFAAK